MHSCECRSRDNFEIVVVFLRDVQRLATLHRCCCIRHIASVLCNGCYVVSIVSFRGVYCFILFFFRLVLFFCFFARRLRRVLVREGNLDYHQRQSI